MARRTKGLTKRGNIWYINKTIKGKRVFESTGTNRLEEAERFLERRVAEIREAELYGRRPARQFIEAATKYLNEESKKSLWRDADSLKMIMPFIGNLTLDQVHAGSLQPYINHRKKNGIKASTINRDLAIVRRILNLAARYWRDDSGLTWLAEAPLLRMLAADGRSPYVISQEEEQKLIPELPAHQVALVRFALNTGCRNAEMCQLKWSEERSDLDGFVITGERSKNGFPRFIPLNSIAKQIIEAQRGVHSEYVFTYKGNPMPRLAGKAWRDARARAGLDEVRVHDLRHTFGHRLRAAGIRYDDRQDLLGHKSYRMTHHYCLADVEHLVEAVERLIDQSRIKSRVIRL